MLAQICTFRAAGGDSPPTFRTAKTLIFHGFTTASRSVWKRCVSTASPPLKGLFSPVRHLFIKFSRRFTAAWSYWTILSNSFLNTPAAHRLGQNWTHLPKTGEVDFLRKPNFGPSFWWRKNSLPVDGGKFRSPLSQEVFLKNRKNRRAIKTEFSALI